MKKIFVPTTGTQDWQRLLANPNKHWRMGFSARTMANAWEAANQSFPPEIVVLLSSVEDERVNNLDMVLAFPEWKVGLPSSGHTTQNDLFVLARNNFGLVTIMVEGKVDESFDETIKEWLKKPTHGKLKRLKFIQSRLGLAGELPKTIRYQLLHRTVSAVIEAHRFHAKTAVMIVHSFNQECKWFEDYQKFLELFQVYHVEPGKLYLISNLNGVALFTGWVVGAAEYLEA